MNWSAPKGTRDFYPEDMVLREHIFNSWENSCKRYGFEKYDAPVFEHLELYTQKSGNEIETQLYTFEDKGGRSLSLRPEMTPSLARMVAAKGQSLKKPVKWYSIPKLFRYEKMQKGRLREFFQLNMDILGVQDISADAELIAAAIDTMRDLGLTSSDFTVHISSRTLLEELFLTSGIAEEKLAPLYALLDKMLKMSKEEFAQQISDILNDTDLTSKVKTILTAKSLDDIEKINSELDSFSELKKLFGYLAAFGLKDYAKFDISIVRGLAYYTGTVFEIFDKKRSMRAIAGGGRYDKLVSLYGGQPTPAVGFATGDVVLSDLLTEIGNLPKKPSKSDVFVVSFAKDLTPVMEICGKLRDSKISAEYPLKLVNIGKQMKQAAAANSHIVLFSGSEEELQGSYKIKIMSSGEEKLISIKDSATELKAILDEISCD
jgi:histidyl-tRNA synthetase